MHLFIAVMALISLVAAQDKYTTKYDNIDLDKILNSNRQLNNYFKCLMDEGRCTPEGNELKRVLPDALETSCEKCSARQRDASERIIKFLTQAHPEEWKLLKAKYDPNDRYVSMYAAAARQAGINI